MVYFFQKLLDLFIDFFLLTDHNYGMKFNYAAGLLFFLALPALEAQALSKELDWNQDGKQDRWVEYMQGNVKVMRFDFDYDGIAEYEERLSPQGVKIYEAHDFNKDGKFDTFYYYDETGLLYLQEIDSNFDGKIDIRVHISEGRYIAKTERDTNFDGVMDTVKEYAKETGKSSPPKR